MGAEFESERRTTREEAAAVLRQIADGVATGELRFGREEGGRTITIPAELVVEIELEEADGERSVEVELEWSDEQLDDRIAVEGGTDASLEFDVHTVGPADSPGDSARFELFLDRADEWRWRLVHRNGNVIATSGEGYTQKHNALNGLRSVIRNAPLAPITDA